MNLKVTIVAENCAGQGTELMGEHGFAALVETDGFALLFDTGQGKVVIPNMEGMEIDFSRIHAIALSHGHYDHTGGLPAVLEKTGKRPVYVGEAAFEPKCIFLPRRGERMIGMPGGRGELEELGADFRIIVKPVELHPGVILTGPIPRVADFESVEPMLTVEKNGEKVPDQIPEDQAVILQGDDGITVLTGCAHSGVVNTLLYAKEITGAGAVHGLIGGTHLLFASDERIEKTVAALKEMQVRVLAPSHCTGFRATAELHRRIGEIMMPANAGTVFKL